MVESTTPGTPGAAAPPRHPLPSVIRVWGWANAACVIGVIAVAVLVRVYWPLIAIILVAAILQIVVGALLLLNHRGVAEDWAAWGRSRSALIGEGSRSVALNRFQGAFAILGGSALVAFAIWMGANLRPLA